MNDHFEREDEAENGAEIATAAAAARLRK